MVASTVAHPWYGEVEVCEGAPVAVSGWRCGNYRAVKIVPWGSFRLARRLAWRHGGMEVLRLPHDRAVFSFGASVGR